MLMQDSIGTRCLSNIFNWSSEWATSRRSRTSSSSGRTGEHADRKPRRERAYLDQADSLVADVATIMVETGMRPGKVFDIQVVTSIWKLGTSSSLPEDGSCPQDDAVNLPGDRGHFEEDAEFLPAGRERRFEDVATGSPSTILDCSSLRRQPTRSSCRHKLFVTFGFDSGCTTSAHLRSRMAMAGVDLMTYGSSWATHDHDHSAVLPSDTGTHKLLPWETRRVTNEQPKKATSGKTVIQ